VTPEREAWALARLAEVRDAIDAVLGDSILLLPTAATAAPAIEADPALLEAARHATLGLTSVAGLSGRPGLSVPWMETAAGPVGLSLVGPRGSDLRLIETALAWEQALR
jgi:Asp-tRNA(Asn)/Glu-tRNA(Gln) amidotransferase A subunit family amidase